MHAPTGQGVPNYFTTVIEENVPRGLTPAFDWCIGDGTAIAAWVWLGYPASMVNPLAAGQSWLSTNLRCATTVGMQ